VNSARPPQDTVDTAAAWNLYREIHEAARDALFGVATRAEDTDAARADAARRLFDALCRVALALDGRRCKPAAPTQLEVARRHTDTVIAQLHRFAKDQPQPPRTRPTRKRC
jgi:hypothetical protein